MDLKTWQKENRWLNRSMAIRLGVSEAVLSRIRTKKANPTFLLAKAIVEFTRGEVGLRDLEVEEK